MRVCVSVYIVLVLPLWRINFIVSLPVQFIPSPVNPLRQEQLKLPALLLQSAKTLQPPLSAAHSSISEHVNNHTHTHTHPFNGPFSETTQVSRYQKGKTNLDFTAARDSEWPWHQLGHMQVCTLLQTDNHASSPPLSFLQAGYPSCRPTNSVKH